MSPFNSKTRAAIWGLGGCGKTALALEFVYRVHTREPDRAIFWIRASDRDHYKKAFRDIAILYDLPGARDLNQDILDAVRTKLADKDTPRWSIVLDNVDDPEVLLSEGGLNEQRLKDYIPSRAGCKVLFTTRDRQAALRLVETFGPALEVECFGHLEAQQLLATIIPNSQSTSDGCVEDFLTELTYLPLAIVQAAAFMRENDIDIGEYLSLLREQHAEDESTDILGQEFEDGSRYPQIGNALTKTWHISFKQLERRNHVAFECLKYLACLACSDIPETLIMPHIKVSRLERVKTIGTLVGYQFLVRQRQGHLFDTHRLVHLATKRWLWSNSAWETCVRSAIGTLSQRIPYGGFQQYSEYSRWLPHGICLLEHIDDVSIQENEASIDLMSRIAACKRDLGDYGAAQNLHRGVLRWRTSRKENHCRRMLRAMHDVAQDAMIMGDYHRAESMHREIFDMRFEYLGLADAETLSSMRNIAEALAFQRQWVECERLSSELTKLSRGWLGMTHAVTLSSLKALSICYCRRGWFKFAEKLAREVVDGRKGATALGEMHPSTLKSISHLALVLVYNQKWEEAMGLESHVSKALELVLGPKHPDTLTSKSNLARIWIHTGRIREARDAFQEILDTRLNVLGPEHPDTLKSINYVSRFCRNQHLPETTRRLSTEPLDSKNLIWTSHESEGGLMCSLPESSIQFPEALFAKEIDPFDEPSVKVDDEDTAIRGWLSPWDRVERASSVYNSGSEGDQIPRNFTLVLPDLELIDPKESWTWLKQNAPFSRSNPIFCADPNTRFAASRRMPNVGSSGRSNLPSRHQNHFSDSGSGSNHGPTSIYRFAMSN